MNANLYSLKELAKAARVPVRQVAELVETGQVPTAGGLIDHSDAVSLVRRLRGIDPGPAGRPPLSLPRRRRGRSALPLMTSSLVHGLGLALLVGIASVHAFRPQTADSPSHVDLVFLDEPGPGGGGGGGGTETPTPPAPAQVKRVLAPPKPKPVSVPPPRQVAIPRPVPLPVRNESKPVPHVVAPVAPVAPDPIDVAGVPAAAPAASPSNGPGKDGGAGNGTGTGAGPGDGAGLGPGSGGGTGGGAFRPGSGVTPPTLEREVKPQYTDDARRRAIEGDVVLEIVVRRDGSVGTVRIVRSLGAGLDERAIDAVRQWRFGPARRSGAPVDVSVTVSVGFSLR